MIVSPLNFVEENTKMFKHQCIIAFILIISELIDLNFGGFMTKYDLEVHSADVCPTNEQLESPLRNLKFTKINSTLGTLSYDITYKRALDENVGLQLKLQKWAEQGWTVIPLFPYQKDVCRSSLKSSFSRDMWINWGRHMNVSEPEKCPVPAGHYSMKDALLDLNLVKKVPFWSGNYRVFIIERLNNGKMIYCLQINFETKEIMK